MSVCDYCTVGSGGLCAFPFRAPYCVSGSGFVEDPLCPGEGLHQWCPKCGGSNGDEDSLPQRLISQSRPLRVPRRHLEITRLPLNSERKILEYFGAPGEGLVSLALPYPMKLSWDLKVSVSRTRCHELCAKSLAGALETIRDQFGQSGIEDARLDRFGGVFNKRRQRGGRAWSLHAFGAAIDLDPLRNGLWTPWPEKATMPEEVIEIFESAGWSSGARMWCRDAMHFQATTPESIR